MPPKSVQSYARSFFIVQWVVSCTPISYVVQALLFQMISGSSRKFWFRILQMCRISYYVRLTPETVEIEIQENELHSIEEEKLKSHYTIEGKSGLTGNGLMHVHSICRISIKIPVTDTYQFSKPPFRNVTSYINLHMQAPQLLVLQRWKTPGIMRRTLIATRIIMQVQLMIILCVPPSTRLKYLGCDRPTLPPLFLRSLCNLLRLRFLLRVMVEDGGTVLGATIHALPILGCRIMHFVKEFEEGGVLDFFRIEYYLKRFGVCDYIN